VEYFEFGFQRPICFKPILENVYSRAILISGRDWLLASNPALITVRIATCLGRGGQSQEKRDATGNIENAGSPGKSGNREARLVLYTFGNASGIDRNTGLVAIKPSGVPYETMAPEDIVLCDLNDNIANAKPTAAKEAKAA
jgi:hypothetical protein